MGRSTKQNKLTTPELIAQVNPENIRLMNDFLGYLRSMQRSPSTIRQYESDLKIFFVFLLQNCGNKFYVNVSKRDIVAYQNWLINENGTSPARVRRLKSAIASLGNYVENILDDEYQGFRQIVRKIENPAPQLVREKTVLTEDQVQFLLDTLIAKKKYMQACVVALAAYSGARKSELLRFKTDYFKDENLICSGALWRTSEKIKTKGRGLGKYIYKYILVSGFQPYFDLWMQYRHENDIESEWLFPSREDPKVPAPVGMLDGWTAAHSRILGVPVYFPAYRQHFTTMLSKQGLPDSVIKTVCGWDSVDMVSTYKDIDEEDELESYFEDGGFKNGVSATLASLGKR